VAAVWRLQDPWPFASRILLLDKNSHTSFESLYPLHLASKIGFEDFVVMICSMQYGWTCCCTPWYIAAERNIMGTKSFYHVGQRMPGQLAIIVRDNVT